MVLERSVYSDIVFAEAMNKMGYLDAHGPNRKLICNQCIYRFTLGTEGRLALFLY